MPATPATIALCNAEASIPEHSVAFIEAVSGGCARIRDHFLFFAADGWLVAMGYPLGSPPETADPAAFFQALESVAEETNARDIWAIAPQLPPELAPYREETDAYYTLPAKSPVPKRLKNPVAKARQRLRIEEGKEFTAAHRKLWVEFLRRKELKPQVRELFARTPHVLAAPGTDIRLLNAWNEAGGLAACLVMDYAPRDFCAYIIGAHSREAHTPHAGDALFASMLEYARREGKKYIHLGLGVNDGIRRFKEKWGGAAAFPYQAAAWKRAEKSVAPGGRNLAERETRDIVRSSLLPPAGDAFSAVAVSGDQLPDERPFAMLWRLDKNGKTSWIGGTAHSFRYSFGPSFRKLFRAVDTVIFEGPLDPASLALFGSHGRARDADTPCVAEHLTETEILHLERAVYGPRGKWAAFCNMVWPCPVNVREILAGHRPWSVFFSLYNTFLERNGWTLSVDLEAWKIAHAMNRNVIGMESIDEQIASLESVPMERIIRFLQHPEDWNRRMKQSLSAYLSGDLKRMLNTSAEFPTRTNTVIGLRDQRFRERMRPYLEQGRAAVFVGTAHMLNLETMLRKDGFTVTKVLPTLRHKLKACLSRED